MTEQEKQHQEEQSNPRFDMDMNTLVKMLSVMAAFFFLVFFFVGKISNLSSEYDEKIAGLNDSLSTSKSEAAELYAKNKSLQETAFNEKTQILAKFDADREIWRNNKQQMSDNYAVMDSSFKQCSSALDADRKDCEIKQQALQAERQKLLESFRSFVRKTDPSQTAVVIQDHIMAWILDENYHSILCYPSLANKIVKWSKNSHYPLLMFALASAGSQFNPQGSTNDTGLGLWKVSPKYVPELREQGILRAERELYDPEINMKAALYLLGKVKENDLDALLREYSGSSDPEFHKQVKVILGELWSKYFFVMEQTRGKMVREILGDTY